MDKITIKDVAREAGVSISTVSNALNNVNVLHPKTKEHILEVAERLNYIPNLNGKNLKAKSTNAIGLIVSSMKGTFFGVLADSMYWACRKRGYELTIQITEDQNSIMGGLLGKKVDGAVVLHPGITDENIEILRKYKVPMVFLDREIEDETLASVVFDSYTDGYTVGRFLVEKGVRSFGYLAGPEGNYDGITRLKGYRDALQEAGYQLEEDHIWDGGFQQDISYHTIDHFIKEGGVLPEAVFAGNDYSAFGCIDALQEHNIRVPEDICVVGCDDIDMAGLFRPRLTTIRTAFEQMGTIAAEELLNMIIDHQEGRIQRLEGRLIERDTCRKHKEM